MQGISKWSNFINGLVNNVEVNIWSVWQCESKKELVGVCKSKE